MPAMPGACATIAARPPWVGMPSQDCLYIRLGDYLEARRHAPDDDRAEEAPADGQASHPAGSGQPEQEIDSGDQDR
jgi:hypothetical protein